MSTGLPIELVLEIFRHASEIFVASDRASAVALAKASRLAYTIVRPILLRRVAITDNNADAIDNLLLDTESAALILDFNITTGDCDPMTLRIYNLTNIRCIRGIAVLVRKTIAQLPESGRASLFKIQLWDAGMHPIPPLITHLCLYSTAVDDASLPRILECVNSTPSLTHLGCEFVVRTDSEGSLFQPETLVTCLRAILDAGGSQILQVAVRLCGHIVATDVLWDAYLMALWAADIEEPSGNWAHRVHLWRDVRCFNDSSDDVAASIADGMAGVDVWSEARPLQTLLADADVAGEREERRL